MTGSNQHVLILSIPFILSIFFMALHLIYEQAVGWVCREPHGEFRSAGPVPRALFPGSFNPLHHGHVTLAGVAEAVLGIPVAFELSVANVDKPDLPADEVSRRLQQFHGRAPVFVTRAPVFTAKAALFPATVFVVGADTAARIVHPRYYGDDPVGVFRALDLIRSHGCRFLVGGRVDRDRRFVDVAGVSIPPGYRDMFAGLGEGEFRVDVSSTKLRGRGTG